MDGTVESAAAPAGGGVGAPRRDGAVAPHTRRTVSPAATSTSTPCTGHPLASTASAVDRST